MKIYQAAKFGQKMEMREHRTKLEAAGHEVTAQWVYVEEGLDTDATEDKLMQYAKMDVDDVLRSNVLVAFSQPRSTTHTGGGRHVEFGVALHAGVEIIVVGPKGEHIFHYMPGVVHVPDVDALLVHLEKMQKGEV
jgi:hypothetical protein